MYPRVVSEHVERHNLRRVAACRIQARVCGFAVRQMLRQPTPAPFLFGAMMIASYLMRECWIVFI